MYIKVLPGLLDEPNVKVYQKMAQSTIIQNYKYRKMLQLLFSHISSSFFKQQLKNLVEMWLRTQKDEENLVSALISTLEDGQRRTGANCLNSLIAWLKEKDAEGEYFHVKSQKYSDQIFMIVLSIYIKININYFIFRKLIYINIFHVSDTNLLQIIPLISFNISNVRKCNKNPSYHFPQNLTFTMNDRYLDLQDVYNHSGFTQLKSKSDKRWKC